MNHYKIAKPTYSAKEWAGYVLLRIFIFPVLIWDAFKWIINRIVGRPISNIVLQAQGDPGLINDANRVHDLIQDGKYQIETHDGAVLDTFMAKHPSQKDLPIEQQKFIINFVGNGMGYEELLTRGKDNSIVFNDSELTGCNVVGFNYRNVGRSTGTLRSQDNLVTDGIAQVQHLLNQGVKPENITLKGYSLGGAIATTVAAHFHRQDKPMYLFNSRSFSSITNFIVGRAITGGNNGHNNSMGKRVLFWFLKPFIWLGVNLANWEINAGAAFREIPEKYREYMVARAPKVNGQRDERRVDDPLIRHYASIHSCLPKKERNNNIERKFYTENKRENAHCSAYEDLTNRSNQTAQSFFCNFVKNQNKADQKDPGNGAIPTA